tara:strand:- start:246 stop:422 length:177 start_codon:yes stop_codon:yes gene_type:complete
MATKEDIARLIADSVGYPVPTLAEAIFRLDHPVGTPEIQREDMAPTKETRILSAAETR